jgi:flavin-dependent dehydrogenase
MSSTDFDVVVIGAGPAGVAAALPLLAAGRRVLVLERGPLEPPKLPETLLVTDGSPRVCADLVARVTCEAMLPFDACFIAADGGSRLRIEFTEDGGATRFVRLDRSRFDRLLRQAAVDAGAVLRCNEGVTGVTLAADPQQPALVAHAGAQGPRMTEARLVIDASGKACFLRGALRLEDRGHVLDGRGGWFTHLLVGAAGHERLPATVNIIPFESGFAYAVWIDATRLSLGLTLFAPTTDPGEMQYEQALARIGWLSALLCDARRVLPVIPVQNRECQVQRLATPQYLVAGDAAGFRDPFYCNGILTALETGDRAGRTALDLLASATAARATIASAYERGYWASIAAGDDRMRRALSRCFEPFDHRHLTDPHVPYPISAALVKLAAHDGGEVATQMGSLRRAV